MELTLHKSGSKSTGKLTLQDEIFATSFNEPLIHQVLTAYMAGARSGSKAQKTRAEVHGGGRKPWRQKGTGRARAGTIRSPIWRGGGITFAAKPRDYSQKVNRKMYRGAMRSILSELARQDRLLIVDDIKLDVPKTGSLVEKLAALGAPEALIVTHEINDNLYLASRNLYRVDVILDSELDPYSLIGFDRVIITEAAIKQIEARLS
ncbi:MAG: 50S ribosomal protein L4 [Gammaproteobacteria bacterium]